MTNAEGDLRFLAAAALLIAACELGGYVAFHLVGYPTDLFSQQALHTTRVTLHGMLGFGFILGTLAALLVSPVSRSRWRTVAVGIAVAFGSTLIRAEIRAFAMWGA